MSNKKRYLASLIILLVMGSLLFFRSRNAIKIYEAHPYLFNTQIAIKIYDKKNANKTIKEVKQLMETIDNKYNSHRKGSYFWHLNQGEEVEVEKEDITGLKEIFAEIDGAYTLTKGGYDITISPLLKLWGLDTAIAPGDLPSEKELDKALKIVDYQGVTRVEDDTSYRLKLTDTSLKVETGSFLKGYAIKKAKDYLEEQGYSDYLISAVSSISSSTPKYRDPWLVALQNPDNPKETLEVIQLNGESLSVSGDYQNYIEIAGKKYHHLLDTKTGYPIRDKKMVALISKDTFRGDIYSTALFSMPVEEILAYVNKTSDLEVLIIDSNGKEYFSKGFTNYLRNSK